MTSCQTTSIIDPVDPIPTPNTPLKEGPLPQGAD